ncbi:MAG: tol-pal system protein YbgF [Alphaproteobacteria bacterium]
MRHRFLGLIFLALALLAVPHGAQAQDDDGGSTTIFETRVSALENQLRLLNGRLEQAEFQNKQLRTQLERLQGDANTRLNALERQPSAAASPVSNLPASPASNVTAVNAAPTPRAAVAPAQPAATASHDSDAAEAPQVPVTPVEGQLGNLYYNGKKVTGADHSARTPPLPAVPSDYGLTAREQYDRAFSLLRNAEYDEAETAFKNFIEKNPQDKLIDNAKYWLGETYYVRNQHEAAAVAFADAYQAAPKGSKAPDSLLKLGMALGALGKHDDACTTLGEVKNKFPSAPATVKSRTDQEMKKLQCGGR